MQLIEHRRKPMGLADLLMQHALVDDGILLQQDGSLLAAWAYRGPDMMSSPPAEMDALSARLNSALKLGTGWMLQCDAIRTEAPGYPDAGAFVDPTTKVIDDERRQQFMAEEAHYETEYFLGLTYLPPVESEQKIREFLFEGRKSGPAYSASQTLDRFRSQIERFENVFGSLFKIERLARIETTDDLGGRHTDDRLLRYVRRCLSGNDHAFAVPEIPVFLNDVIACADFHGGIEPRIGAKHIRVLAIDGFPRCSSPGLLRELDSLPLEYRWNTRALMLDAREAEAILDKTRKKWRSKIRGWRDQILKTQSGAVNLYAAEMATDAEQAMSVANSGDVQFAWYSSNVICMDEDVERLHQSTRTIMKVLQRIGFSCRVETVNSVEAWRGSLPGDGYRNVRRNLLHTLNIADLLPITAIWAGQRENPSALMPRKSPPLLYAATSGSTPFRFNLHVGDLGHTMICGPSGSGKSTLLGLIAAQWFRYPGAKLFAFDRGYSLYVLTHACGGEFYDLAGPGSDLAFCPLRNIDSDADRIWAVGWIEALCRLNGQSISPSQRNRIAEGVENLRMSPTRSLTELRTNVQDEAVQAALQHYTLGGPLGSLLDAEADGLRGGRFLTFETEHLLQLDDKAVLPVLLYLFRQIEKSLDGSPALVLLDEAWSYLKHELFRERMRDWLKTMRKKNGVVVMATQQLSDVLSSGIADAILEACPTKILLPNAESKSPACRSFYELVGLNHRELDILQTSIPKQHYYVVSPLGRRLVEMAIGKVGLSFVGVNGRDERRLMEQIREQFGDRWRSEWLRFRGLSNWAAYFDRIAAEFEGDARCAKAS